MNGGDISMELFFGRFSGLPRQGAGSRGRTLLALQLVPPLSALPGSSMSAAGIAEGAISRCSGGCPMNTGARSSSCASMLLGR